MAQQMDSKEAASVLIDPMMETEPSSDTGPGSHFGSTFAPAKPAEKTDTGRSSLSSNNPFRDSVDDQRKPSASHSRGPSGSHPGKSSSPSAPFPTYRDEAFGSIDPTRRRSGDHRRSGDLARHSRQSSDPAAGANRPRRGSSLKERYPGDTSTQPLEVLRRDSKKAHRSPHLRKAQQPGADVIDRLDPAIGGKAYHHEGPYDAALLSRNRDPKYAPLAAVEGSNKEAIKATPKENVRDALENHRPLDGTAFVPSGETDRFGRTYQYEEGTDMMREGAMTNPGYKRWGGEDYDSSDLAGKGEPSYSLDKALQAHKVNDDGDMELQDRSKLNNEYRDQARKGKLDARDPVEIAGDDAAYADLQHRNEHHDAQTSHAGGLEFGNTTGHQAGRDEAGGSGVGRSGSLTAGLKRRIGSLRHRKDKD